MATQYRKLWRFGCAGMILWLTGCAHTVITYSHENVPETKEEKQVRQLVVTPLANHSQAQTADPLYKIKIMQNIAVLQSVRNVTQTTVRRYPFSLRRKFDDILIGTLGAPFMPLAFIGGVASGEADLLLFPFSAWYPFANFRPDKSGLLTGPVHIDHQVHSQPGPWTQSPARYIAQPLANQHVLITLHGKQIAAISDGQGIVTVDLSQFADAGDSRRDLVLHVRTRTGAGSLTLPSQMAQVLDRTQPKPKTLARRPTVRMMPKKDKTAVAQSKRAVVSDLEIKVPKGSQLFYKSGSYGYWINSHGTAVMALPTHAKTQMYADEYLKYDLKKAARWMQGYYIFDFSFDPISQVALAVKIGTGAREEDALGWVSAQEVALWSTVYRLYLTNPVEIYATSESCRQGNARMARKYGPKSGYESHLLPVLEQRGDIWCIAYPHPQEDSLQFGWIRQQPTSVAQLQVRIMKHKLDKALKFFEDRGIWGVRDPELTQALQTELKGPLALTRATGEMYLAAFNQYKLFNHRYSGSLLDIPESMEEYSDFEITMLRFATLLLKKNLWEGDDVVYVPWE